MLATYNPSFASKMKTSYYNYTCPLIQNDLISITAGLVRSQIVQEVTECGMYALMCDEARSFKEEQLTICVRYTKHGGSRTVFVFCFMLYIKICSWYFKYHT